MAEIPDELENELWHEVLGHSRSSNNHIEAAIRDAIRRAYAEAWERCEEHMRRTVGDWLDQGDLAPQL